MWLDNDGNEVPEEEREFGIPGDDEDTVELLEGINEITKNVPLGSIFAMDNVEEITVENVRNIAQKCYDTPITRETNISDFRASEALIKGDEVSELDELFETVIKDNLDSFIEEKENEDGRADDNS